MSRLSAGSRRVRYCDDHVSELWLLRCDNKSRGTRMISLRSSRRRPCYPGPMGSAESFVIHQGRYEFKTPGGVVRDTKHVNGNGCSCTGIIRTVKRTISNGNCSRPRELFRWQNRLAYASYPHARRLTRQRLHLSRIPRAIRFRAFSHLINKHQHSNTYH
jgi:hypothetical protein